ncbi:MAG: heparinase II/III family protein [bacterium]|nr:heparinase II/III family protein [bacterium]
MALLSIPWTPRVILSGRAFRLPVTASESAVDLTAAGFERISERWSARDSAHFFYLRAPETPGDYDLIARQNGQMVQVSIQVRSLTQLRQPFVYNQAQWPRRWPLGQTLVSAKSRQTLQDIPLSALHEQTRDWWASQPDTILFSQLPPAEIPRAHFVNAHQGSPTVGTAVFSHSGFYPWKRNHLPCDFRSICPVSGDVFPSNDLMHFDYTSGPFPDDGYGFFDADGSLYLFAATYARDQFRAFGQGIAELTNALRHAWHDDTARALGVMLLRYAFEECYVAAVPQFRYGPSRAVEEPWDWGQPDWASATDPVSSLARNGSLRYSIDTPYIAETLALAYDTLWPFLKTDDVLVARARAIGVPVDSPDDAVQLIEEMLACLLQCILDRAASSNLPRESQGALSLVRALDRSDAQDVLDWLYDDGPDTLRVFTPNNFFPDGFPPESTGGYNSIHINGIFDLEDQLRKLRSRHPDAYPEHRYPSLVGDARAPRIVRASHEVTMGGKTWFQFGDGSAPGSGSQMGPQKERLGSLLIDRDCFHAPMHETTLPQAAAFTGDDVVVDIADAVAHKRHRKIGSTLHDGVGIAILRTPETPENAAVGIVYGDTTGHRHRDLLDLQLFAFGRPFLTDLGYPQSWSSIANWEAHWATHNTVWSVDENNADSRAAGRGRVVRTLFTDGLQALEIEANRWFSHNGQWTKSDIVFRRLVALIETEDSGVVLVDFSRIQGGSQHWRTCRGLEGIFQTAQLNFKGQTGTVAGVDIVRGQTQKCRFPDDSALAYMDQVQLADPPKSWQGTWRSAVEPQVFLDLHQVDASDQTQFMTARATAVMGTPEKSNYTFQTALWRRTPRSNRDTTHIDLVFEPHVSNPTIASVERIPGDEASSAVRLTTKKGRQIEIYWTPTDSNQSGHITACLDKKCFSVGKPADNKIAKPQYTCPIKALDRGNLTIDIELRNGLSVGDRVCINPQRGHVYRVENMEAIDHGYLRIQLDVTSILGHGQVLSVEDKTVHLRYHIMARTGNLHNTWLMSEQHESGIRIASAYNSDRQTTSVYLAESSPFRAGDWVTLVDYVIGDPVVFEPIQEMEYPHGR